MLSILEVNFEISDFFILLKEARRLGISVEELATKLSLKGHQIPSWLILELHFNLLY